MQNKGGEVPGFGAIFLVYQGKRSSGCVNQQNRQKRKNSFFYFQTISRKQGLFKSARKTVLPFCGTFFFGYRESNVNCNMLWLLNINWFNLIGYITEVRQKFSCNVISILLNLSEPDLVEQRPFFTQPWPMKGGTSSKRQSKKRLKFSKKPFEPKFDPVLNISQLHRVHATIPY